MIDRTADKQKISGLYFSLLVIVMLVFSVVISAVILPFGEQALETDWYKFLSFLVSPIAIFSVTLCFKFYYNQPLKEFCQIKKTQAKYYIFAIFIFVSVFVGLGNLNGIFINFLTEKFGYTPSLIELPKFTVPNFILVIITLCVFPALMEEIAIRGVVLNGIKTGKTVVNALIGGLIFSLFHMNPAQTPYQFVVGFAFSLLAIKSKSTLPTALAHFLNNLAVVLVEYFFPTLFSAGGWVGATFSICGTFIFVATLVLLLFEKGEDKNKSNFWQFCLYALSGVGVCSFMWIMNLVV